MSDPKVEEKPEEAPSHWQLLRDVVAFQFKLAMDGLRDVLLSPISIIAAIAGLMTSRSEPGRYFYRLLQFGHRTDRWINLFNTYNDDSDEVSADHFVRRAEEIVLKEYNKGGTMQHIKNRADGALDRLHRAGENRKPDAGDQ